MSVAHPTSAARPPLRRGRFLALAGLAAIVLAAGLAILWKQVLEDRCVPRRWGVVEPGALYRSGQLSEALIRQMLLKHHIRVVVDLTPLEPGNAAQEAEDHVLDELGLESVHCPLSGDGTGAAREYVHALTAIGRAQREGKRVLVHCQAGSQRTGGVIAAWRLLVQKKTPAAAAAEMKRYGWRPHRDEILRAYLNAHMQEIASGLVDASLIDRVPEPLPQLPP